MRNNEERLQKPTESAKASAIISQTEQKKSFEFPSFTDIVELPSEGKFYGPEHPLHNKESVEVFYMTSKEEDVLTSETLLENGLMFDKLISSVLKDKKIKSKDLLDADRSAVLISVRKTGMGPDYTVTNMPCPECNNKQEVTANLNSDVYINDNQKDLKDLDITRNGDSLFNYKMKWEDIEVDIGFKLLDGVDEGEIFKKTKKIKKTKSHEKNFTNRLKQIIVSVNGREDKLYIQRFCENMPYIFAKDLLEQYSAIVPTIQIKTEFECESCGWAGLLEVPVTKNFFWPDL